MDNEHYTLISKIGYFFVPKSVPLNLAKLVRDTVTGQFLCPLSNGQKLETVMDAHKFMAGHDSKILAGIPFELELR